MANIPKKILGIKYLEQAYYLIREPPSVLPAFTGCKETVNRFLFNTGDWRKLGLYHDDILFEYPHIKEAIRRLPLEVQDERNFRLVRAIQLDIKQIWLPTDQWTKYEDDCTKGRYMQPYIKDVLDEIKLAELWEAEH